MGTVACYLDTNILVALLTPEPFSERADSFLRSSSEPPIVSDFAVAEFSSAMARRARMREFTVEEAGIALSGCDAWLARAADCVEIGTGDIVLATTYIRRLDLVLAHARRVASRHRPATRRNVGHPRPRDGRCRPRARHGGCAAVTGCSRRANPALSLSIERLSAEFAR